MTFKSELTSLLNSHSIENGSDTPDFMLAEHLLDCLTAFDKTTRGRDRWWDRPISYERILDENPSVTTDFTTSPAVGEHLEPKGPKLFETSTALITDLIILVGQYGYAGVLDTLRKLNQ